MIPGELILDEGSHALNPGRRTLTLVVKMPATGRFRSARTTTLPKPMPAWISTALPPTACA
jgi:hypothetical protein